MLICKCATSLYLLEVDVRFIHIFDLRYEEVREHTMIPFPIIGY